MRKGATALVFVGALKAVGATVMWVTDGAAGLKFATTIDPEAARARAFISPPTAPASRDPQLTPFKAGWIADRPDP